MFVSLHVGNFLYKGIDSRETFICKTIVDIGRCLIKVIAKDILQKSNQVSLWLYNNFEFLWFIISVATLYLI